MVEKVPTKSSTKIVMHQWLALKGIPFEETDLKAALFHKISQTAPNRKLHQADELSKHLGTRYLEVHAVAHCELKPIELVWSHVNVS